jgi:hypothetical protein
LQFSIVWHGHQSLFEGLSGWIDKAKAVMQVIVINLVGKSGGVVIKNNDKGYYKMDDATAPLRSYVDYSLNLFCPQLQPGSEQD